MTETETMCAFCREKPAVFDAPVSCSECFLAFMALFGSLTQKRLEDDSEVAEDEESM